jgi:hypothetical protein
MSVPVSLLDHISRETELVLQQRAVTWCGVAA